MTEQKITQKDANFNLKEWKTTRKIVFAHYGSSKSVFLLFCVQRYIYRQYSSQQSGLKLVLKTGRQKTYRLACKTF